MSEAERIELGDRAKDRISGMEGIVIGETNWLYMCRRLTIQPESLDEKGGPKEAHSFDEAQLILVRKGVVPVPEVVVREPVAARSRATGGPAPEVSRGPTITRP